MPSYSVLSFSMSTASRSPMSKLCKYGHFHLFERLLNVWVNGNAYYMFFDLPAFRYKGDVRIEQVTDFLSNNKARNVLPPARFTQTAHTEKKTPAKQKNHRVFLVVYLTRNSIVRIRSRRSPAVRYTWERATWTMSRPNSLHTVRGSCVKTAPVYALPHVPDRL